jgi:D-glycero-D-manno-heptose 1,7-bisphosphate phosphatase
MPKIPDKQGVFFELDGVVLANVRLNAEGDLDYLGRAVDALGHLDPRLFRLFVATSRRDIAFGELKEREFTRTCEVFLARMQKEGIPITKIYSCPYHPKGKGRFRKDSVFRKPSPGIFKMAQQEFDLNLMRCWMVGHTTADILAAQRADVGTILVRSGAAGGDQEYVVEPHFVEDDLWSAVMRINQFEHALRV